MPSKAKRKRKTSSSKDEPSTSKSHRKPLPSPTDTKKSSNKPTTPPTPSVTDTLLQLQKPEFNFYKPVGESSPPSHEASPKSLDGSITDDPMSPEEKKDDREDSDIEQESREENDNEDDTGDRESVATSSSSGSRASGKPKGVLVPYRSKLAPQKRKRVSWPNELVAKVHYFEFDADERENVCKNKAVNEDAVKTFELERRQFFVAKMAKQEANAVDLLPWPEKLFVYAERATPFEDVASKSEEKIREEERQSKCGEISEFQVCQMDSPLEPLDQPQQQLPRDIPNIPLDFDEACLTDYSKDGYPLPHGQEHASPAPDNRFMPPPADFEGQGVWRAADATPMQFPPPHPMFPPQQMMNIMPPPPMGLPPGMFPGAPMGPPPGPFIPRAPCTHFMRTGDCRYENRCRFLHVRGPVPPPVFGGPPIRR